MSEEKTIETIPFWLAVALVTIATLPTILYPGQYRIPLWAAFTTWAAYFSLGAKPSVIFGLIVPNFFWGSFWTTMALWTWMLMVNNNVIPDVAPYITFFIFISILVWSMKFWKVWQQGALALFLGVSMTIAIFATGFFPATGNYVADPWISMLWAWLTATFGAFLGWINIIITFPRKVRR